MRKLAVFDLDGTLLYTLKDLADACNYALESFGHPTHPEEAYKTLVGRGIYNMARDALPEGCRDDDTVVRLQTVFQKRYNAHATDNTHPYPGIVEMLQNIRQAGIHVAVLSNKPHRFTVPMVMAYFPELVDLPMGQRDEMPLKPDPAALVQIITHFDLAREDCVYVGDSNVDMQTGKNAGLFTVGVTWGYRTEQELLEAGASAVVHKVEALESILIDK